MKKNNHGNKWTDLYAVYAEKKLKSNKIRIGMIIFALILLIAVFTPEVMPGGENTQQKNMDTNKSAGQALEQWGNPTTRYKELQYVPESMDPSIAIETEELVFKVIDNTGLLAPQVKSTSYFNESRHITPFVHHLGYHGIRTLYNKTEKRNLVIPFSSWLNLQKAELTGIPVDPLDERSSWGMGRGWPLRMERKDRGALLILDPLPNMQMYYSIGFQPAEPDGVDFSIRFRFGRRPESGPARFRASWPCYMNAYDDVRLFYPKGKSADNWEWAGIGEKVDVVLGETVNYKHVQRGYTAHDQALPLGYGRIGEKVLIFMFSDPSVQMFVVVNGGYWPFLSVQSPAWDFQWMVENYPLNQTIGFDGRIIYTHFTNQDEILRRYHEWKKVR